MISTLDDLKNENITDKQSLWEYLKYEIIIFLKNVSKKAACSNKIKCLTIETKLKILEPKIRYRDDPEYIHCKEELDKLYQGKINGAIIRSRCEWYECGEKSSKLFLSLEEKSCCSKSNKNHLLTDQKKEY